MKRLSNDKGSKLQIQKWFLLLSIPLCLLVLAFPGSKPLPLTPGPKEPAASSETWPKKLNRMEETGKRLYVSICAYCHGLQGDGFGLNASNLAVPPRDHTDGAYMHSRSDEQLLNVIRWGGASQGKSPLMPAWNGRLSDREITALVAYLRTLASQHDTP